MRPRAAERELADRLHSLAIHLLRRVAAEDEKSGLSAARLSALSVIVFRGPLSLGELARAERVQPPSMTRVVQALEASGLVRRKSSDDDRRVVQVRATAKGDRLLQAARRRRIGRLAAALAGLDGGERRQVAEATGLLEDVVATLEPRP